MWQNKEIYKYQKFSFADFDHAFVFIQGCAQLSKKFSQLPTWKQQGPDVEIWLEQNWIELSESIDNLVLELHKTSSALVADKKTTSLSYKITDVKLYTDGGSRGNPGPSACAHVIMDMSDNVIEKSGSYLGITTNNQAEYQALFRGLEAAYAIGAKNIEVYMDSLLVVNQLKGIFKVKNRELWPVYEATRNFSTNFSKISFNHVPREYNKLADLEVNLILDEQ